MSAAVAAEPTLLHALPGRVRVHVPDLADGAPWRLEGRLRRLPGVRGAQANPLTGNVLVRFDPALTDKEQVLAAVREAETGVPETAGGTAVTHPEQPVRKAGPRALRERQGDHGRARIAVRGLDRDPRVARRVVDHLRRQGGVRRVSANPLTGRVLVEFDAHLTDIQELVSEVSGIELPDLPGEDRPTHPLDPQPLIQGASRTVGAGLGLGLLAGRQLFGLTGAPVGGGLPAQAAGVIGIVQGFPATRNGLRALLGRDLSDVLFQGAAIISLALAGSPLGLAVTGAEGLRLLTEIVARRRAWRRYEARVGTAADAVPGATIRLESGERAPLGATVVEGTGTASGRDGLPAPVAPGGHVPAGARLHGGPFVLTLEGGAPFTPQPRPAPIAPTLYDRYVNATGLLSLGYAALTAVLTRSFARTFAALLLVTPRPAVIGMEAATVGASARVLRAGVTVVGTRPERIVRRPDTLLIDGPRVLTDGFEATGALPLTDGDDPAALLGLAAGVAAAAGAPWGGAFPAADRVEAGAGAFDGTTASARIGAEGYTLGPLAAGDSIPAAMRLRHRGEYLLALRRAGEDRPRGFVALRPRLAAGGAEVVETCRRYGVAIGLLPGGDPLAAAAVARRAGVALLDGGDDADGAVAQIRARQAAGQIVAFLADSADAGAAFAACDLAIGLTSGRSGRFPARADLLAPELGAVAAIVEAGAARAAATRDAVGLAIVANAVGAVWGFRGAPRIERASLGVYAAALGALADGGARLRGGARPAAVGARLADPRPERWGGRDVAATLRELRASPDGLTTVEAAARQRGALPQERGYPILGAVLDQLRSPITGILAVGAGFSLALGAPADVAFIGGMIAVNAAMGVWQERQAGRAAEALARIGAATARVLRDGEPVTIPASAVVPGDILVLAPGDRVAADARVIAARGLEVDEAALTGESLPVPKVPGGGTAAGRVVLEGSDVTVGTARAVVVAVGGQTRLGATAAALALDETGASPLGQRLGRLLRQFLPLAAAGGAIVVGSGLLRGRPLVPQLAVGASIALAAVPEGLPLLAGVGEAGVARRLAKRRALVRRLAAVEALGRVDVACTDKTGTLTTGRLALCLVADAGDGEAGLPGALPAALRAVLLTAALASPHPDAPDAGAHPTDLAVTRGAEGAGLGAALRMAREAEAAFDPARAFHAALAGGRLRVKGAAEALAPRCARIRAGAEERPLDEAGRRALLARAAALAARGLRVLLVAEGAADAPTADPRGLVALGFVGIADPLRPGVPDAVRRCREAGVRLIMLTGDHPATARAIAREAGLLDQDGAVAVLTGAEIAELEDGALDRRLESAAVIARITPLDKLRIVESLRRHGHVVAMTGDGVNDAPALRLADVGVAMGAGGTEVARQAADVVLADDDFATLVEALVEGRSFWRNIRRALGLLLGGNLGELGLVVGASLLGLASPLLARQILAVNLITDALPALAIALQPPESRHLAGLAREGEAALDAPLRRDVLRRGVATALPSLVAYGAALATAGLAQARTVAFAAIVGTQLAQTLDAGRAEAGLSWAVLGAVGASVGVLVAALTVPPLRAFLSLALPTPASVALIVAAALAAVPLGRVLALARPAPAGAAPRAALSSGGAAG